MRELLLAEKSLTKTNEAMFEELIQHYLKKVLRLVYLMVKDRNLAEDITQEVFLRAYKNLGSFRRDSSMQTWVYRIAVNEAKKHLRSWSFRHIFFKPEIDSGIVEGTESTVLQNDRRVHFARLVMKLPHSYRQLIVLHYYEELPIEEIAIIMDMSTGAVYTKMHRARQKLKALLETEGIE
ncbi:sigma-70 family RNA polymerase sigma factor [Brevibacillus antibioticus]|uniref:Sigma-70 family RNA polymerase sigma factor n=1 Tax=Brevibacillus antibioticus TaxID=2570228 RepID=A0A4U2YG08_9BACL|nr:sigma-70 family RNA polymerase sigma factor [Brevibacillus antibioticus]TKI58481.1 sigma-70 family RNA polymerase sigma factor [Brevibacillus antibioticus]